MAPGGSSEIFGVWQPRHSGPKSTKNVLAVASTDLVLWRLTTNQLDHMKIIFQGSIPKPRANWWTLVPIKCGNCKTEIQLEDDDKPIFGTDRRSNRNPRMEIPCPTCGAAIQGDESSMRGAKAYEMSMRGASPENAIVEARRNGAPNPSGG